MQIREYSIIIHSLLIILFIYIYSQTYYHLLMIIAPLLHIMVVKNNSGCYNNHCHIEIKRSFRQQRLCQVCSLDQWIRMRHCYKCNQCVHKFDHHCVLMGICIGQFNHKHYVLFLYSYTVNTLILLSTFFTHIKNQVTADEYGIQHISGLYNIYSFFLIVLCLNFILGSYLSYNHTIYMLNNQTTWEKVKRHSISYLKNISPDIQFPFSQGYLNNIKQFFHTDVANPIEWKISN